MATDKDAIAIAVLQEQYKSIKEQLTDTNEVLQEVADRLEEIEKVLNRGKGAFTACLLFAGALGSFLTWIIHLIKQ